MPAEKTLDGKPSPTFKLISDELNKNGLSTRVFDKRAFKEKGIPKFEAAKGRNAEIFSLVWPWTVSIEGWTAYLRPNS